MKKTLAHVAALCALLVLAAVPAHTWSPKGHMVVAYVAYKQLDPAVRARADALLTRNPYHARWLTMIPATVPAADRKLAIFMLAATWPDQIKSDPSYRDDGTQGGNVPNGPSSSQNTGYADLLKHKYWHFVDVPFSATTLSLPPIPTTNAQERIGLFLSVLASIAPDALKSYDLTWLLHIVGDVHQPLHAAARITPGDLNGDDGGNGVAVCGGPGCQPRLKLHGVWDGLLGAQDDVAVAMTTARTLPPADAQLAAVLDPAAWVRESFALAKSVAYAAPIGPNLGPFTLSPTYNTNARNTGRAQAALAGARLARVLNRDLK